MTGFPVGLLVLRRPIVAELDVESSVESCDNDGGDVLASNGKNRWITLGQRSEHSFPCCIVFSVFSQWCSF